MTKQTKSGKPSPQPDLEIKDMKPESDPKGGDAQYKPLEGDARYKPITIKKEWNSGTP